MLEVDANYMYSDYLGNSQVSKIYEHSLSREEVDAIKNTGSFLKKESGLYG